MFADFLSHFRYPSHHSDTGYWRVSRHRQLFVLIETSDPVKMNVRLAVLCHQIPDII